MTFIPERQGEILKKIQYLIRKTVNKINILYKGMYFSIFNKKGNV